MRVVNMATSMEASAVEIQTTVLAQELPMESAIAPAQSGDHRESQFLEEDALATALVRFYSQTSLQEGLEMFIPSRN